MPWPILLLSFSSPWFFCTSPECCIIAGSSELPEPSRYPAADQSERDGRQHENVFGHRSLPLGDYVPCLNSAGARSIRWSTSNGAEASSPPQSPCVLLLADRPPHSTLYPLMARAMFGPCLTPLPRPGPSGNWIAALWLRTPTGRPLPTCISRRSLVAGFGATSCYARRGAADHRYF